MPEAIAEAMAFAGRPSLIEHSRRRLDFTSVPILTRIRANGAPAGVRIFPVGGNSSLASLDRSNLLLPYRNALSRQDPRGQFAFHSDEFDEGVVYNTTLN